MKRVSPLQILGLLSALLGLTIPILTGGYLIILGACFIGLALILFLLDWLSKKARTKNSFWILQIILSISYLAFLTFSYLDWNKHNLIVFPADFKGESGIIFGIEGYPELPEMQYWKRTIEIPTTGILITSTKEEELPNKFQFQYKDGSTPDFRDSTWNFPHSTEYSCILTNSEIKHHSFKIGNSSNSEFQTLLASLCDSINKGSIVSFYKTASSPIVTSVETPYLQLQNRNLSTLPANINKLQIKKIILTGNNFTAFPKEVLSMPQLEELLIGHNPVSKLPEDLESLKNLKRLSINSTLIKHFPNDLSNLENLETIGLDHNEFDQVPESILTIPNLKKLRLNNNKLTNLKFINERLSNLSSIYLYSNKIQQIDYDIENLVNLRELLIFDNEIDSIPAHISSLTKLEKLEIWSNPIRYVSPEIKELKKLKSLRMEKDNLTEEQRASIRKWLPNCEVNFQ